MSNGSSQNLLAAVALIASRYEIRGELGRGGMGVVFRAYDRVLDEVVAIKVLRPEVADTPEVAQRFFSEIKLARAVSHRNVCRIHDYGEDRGLRYISMAYVDGTDLKRVLRQRGPLPAAEAFEVTLQVAEGLQAIHDEGIIHRDLKTPNLMLDGRGVVRLMDFGIAKLESLETALQLTATGSILGTPEYMSPEQVLGQKIDARSDLYALGIVVFELFTGVTPFRADTPLGTAMKHLREPPPLRGPEAALLPPAIVLVLEKALAKDREQRFASARQMAEALRAARDAGLAEPLAPAISAVSPGLTPARSTEVVAKSSGGLPSPSLTPTMVPTAVPTKPVPSARATTRTGVGQSQAATPARAGGLSASHQALLVGAALGLIGMVTAAPFVLRQVARGRLAQAPSSPESPSTVEIQPPTPSSMSGVVAAPQVRSSPLAQTAPASGPASAPPPVLPRRTAEPASPTQAAAGAEVAGLIAEAEGAFAVGQYQMALDFYDQVLRLDVRSVRAQTGRDLCAQALRRIPAADAREPGSRSFVSGQTMTALDAPADGGPRGFRPTGATQPRRVDSPPPLPGRIYFEAQPAAPHLGEPFVVKVYLFNESGASLALRELVATTTADGETAGGSLAPLTEEVAPGERGLLTQVRGFWKAGIQSWVLRVIVRTTRGDAFRNELVWQ